jgi:hypothetical protein
MKDKFIAASYGGEDPERILVGKNEEDEDERDVQSQTEEHHVANRIDHSINAAFENIEPDNEAQRKEDILLEVTMEEEKKTEVLQKALEKQKAKDEEFQGSVDEYQRKAVQKAKAEEDAKDEFERSFEEFHRMVVENAKNDELWRKAFERHREKAKEEYRKAGMMLLTRHPYHSPHGNAYDTSY